MLSTLISLVVGIVLYYIIRPPPKAQGWHVWARYSAAVGAFIVTVSNFWRIASDGINGAAIWVIGMIFIVPLFYLIGFIAHWLFRRAKQAKDSAPGFIEALTEKTVGITGQLRESVNPINLDDSDIYAVVSKEMQRDVIDDGLWAKALSLANGDEKVAKARYIKLRVLQIKSQTNGDDARTRARSIQLRVATLKNAAGVTEQSAPAPTATAQGSAAGEEAYSQFLMGEKYRNGEGIPKDLARAVHWFQKAAEQGFAPAQSQLGYMYYMGEGIPKNLASAVQWFQKAAVQGYDEAQFGLGYMYQQGEGIPKDIARAVQWYQKAAVQGFAPAQTNLAEMYQQGEGIPRDLASAVWWFQKAAEQGFAEAQSKLAVMYQQGDGVTIDNVLSYAWANLAVSGGYDKAIALRDSIETELSFTELAEAQQLATNWVAGVVLVRGTQ